MLRKSLSSILTWALTSMMFFSMSVEVFATNEEIPVEDIGNELEIEFVDSMEALDDDLEKKQAGELANGNSLKCHEIPNVVISDEDRIGEELKSSRIDGISTASSDQSVTVSVTGTISEEGDSKLSSSSISTRGYCAGYIGSTNKCRS